MEALQNSGPPNFLLICPGTTSRSCGSPDFLWGAMRIQLRSVPAEGTVRVVRGDLGGPVMIAPVQCARCRAEYGVDSVWASCWHEAA